MGATGGGCGVGALPPNRDMVLARCNDIRGELEVLRAYAARGEADFTADGQAVRSARYALVVLVEAAAAVCAHMAARSLGLSPETYGDCFRRCGSAGLIPPDLGGRLAALARLRNMVVHLYGQVDDGRLLAEIREGLPDVEAYLAAVAAWLRAAGPAPAGAAEGEG